jgi:monofunctional glycosyltransferase
MWNDQNMKAWAVRLLAVVGLLTLALVVYTGKGWYDAKADAPALRERAKSLAAQGLGAQMLGSEKRMLLLTVEDPSFDVNNGTDFSSDGAGQTTITQSLAKRLAFEKFKPGIRKLRQTGYAIGLSQSLSKDDVLTLFLAESSFRGSDGRWTKSFDAASRRFFGKPIADLDRGKFTLLIASGIAPKEMAPDAPNAKLLERAGRIERLAIGRCKPSSHDDVRLEGCKK